MIKKTRVLKGFSKLLEKKQYRIKILTFASISFAILGSSLSLLAIFISDCRFHNFQKEIKPLITPNPTVEIELSNSQIKLNFYKASNAYDKRDYGTVISLLLPVVDQRPDIFNNSSPYSYAYLILGLTFFHLPEPDFNKSKKYLLLYTNQKAHTQFMTLAKETLSRIYLTEKSYKDAKKQATQLIQSGKATYKTYRILGNILLQEKNYTQAIENFNEAVTLNPQDYYSLLGLFSSYIGLNQCDQAKIYFLKMKDAYQKNKLNDPSFADKIKNNIPAFNNCN